MLNQYEQQKLHKDAVHKDMEKCVDQDARERFRRRPYSAQHVNVKAVLEIKTDINYLSSRAGLLDSWERVTIRRIVQRIKEGSVIDG